MNDALIEPVEGVQFWLEMRPVGVDEMLHAVSVVAKLEPVMLTDVPIPAEVGVSAIFTCARAGANELAIGDPQPVTGSHPALAE
jgi:hypothetical protein